MQLETHNQQYFVDISKTMVKNVLLHGFEPNERRKKICRYTHSAIVTSAKASFAFIYLKSFAF